MNGIITRSLDPFFLKFRKANPPTQRGEHISFAWLAEVTGINKPLRLQARLKGWYLREHGIALVKRGEAFVLLHAKEQVRCGLDSITRARRGVGRGAVKTSVVDPLALTEKDRNFQEYTLDVAQRVLASLEGAKKEMKFILRENKPQKLTG